MGFFARRVHPDAGCAHYWEKKNGGNQKLGIRKRICLLISPRQGDDPARMWANGPHEAPESAPWQRREEAPVGRTEAWWLNASPIGQKMPFTACGRTAPISTGTSSPAARRIRSRHSHGTPQTRRAALDKRGCPSLAYS